MSDVVVFNNMDGMTVPEVARYTGKNPETIRRWIREGKLRSERIGTQHIIQQADIDDLLPLVMDPSQL